jgi:Nif-specific regulatory protein
MPTSPAHTHQYFQSLVEISHLLMRPVDSDELLTVILTAAMRLFKAEGCSLALLDAATQELAFIAMVGPAQVDVFRLPIGQGVAGWVAQTGQGVLSNDVTQDARFFQGIDQQTGYTTRSLLCAPLKQHDQILGVIEALNTAKPAGFDADDLALLTAFGELAGPAITRTQAFARARNVGAALQEVVHERYRLVYGTSAAMQEALRLARTVATTNTTVLMLGDSGTGKEVMARAIHQWSPRAEHPFVAVNCVALTPELLASELFGHEKGAFTGAVAQKKGKFELAHGGTLFLDEIGDLAPDLQTKLLRVVQDKEFQRVGGTRDLRVDVRLIAATNRDLQQAMQRGAFREDLYYRLNVVALTLPPLCDRREDIPALVDHFLTQYSREVNRPGLGITPAALELLQAYHWPGNVRELQNTIERAVVLTPGPAITVADFPPEIRQANAGEPVLPLLELDEAMPLAEAVVAFKRARVCSALARARGNQRQAARLLGLEPSNLSRLLHTLGITPQPRGRAPHRQGAYHPPYP